MGRPKLILQVGGVTVIARVVYALHKGGATTVVVVPPPADAPDGLMVAQEAAAAGAEVFVPRLRPADMRASVELALGVIEERPRVPSTILLAPADSPGISAGLVARVIALANEQTGAIVIPVFEGSRGHPIALPWPVALEVRSLPERVGVNALVRSFASRVVELHVDDPGATDDLDTPEDYTRLRSVNERTGRAEPCG